jgi:hypothetical protein
VQPSEDWTSSAPPVSSPEFWKRPERVTASSDPDLATAQTIEIMCQHISTAANDWAVRETALDAMRQFAGLSGWNAERAEDDALASAAWWWCKLFVKFVHHESILRRRLGESGHLQGLISPDVLVRMEKPEGDCAIFTECIAAFLRVYGIPFELVTVAVNPGEPEEFSHVYLYAVMPDGRRFPLDASHGKYPGWQVPTSDVFRRQVWDMNGNPVEDRASRFDGLHNYALRGFGQADQIPADWIPGSPYGGGSGPSYTTPIDTTGPTYTAPSQTSSEWPAFFAKLAQQGFTLAEINAIKPGTVVGPQGQILRQTPGYGVPVGGTALSVSGGAGGSMLLIGVLVIGGVMLVMSMGKR